MHRRGSFSSNSSSENSPNNLNHNQRDQVHTSNALGIYVSTVAFGILMECVIPDFSVDCCQRNTQFLKSFGLKIEYISFKKWSKGTRNAPEMMITTLWQVSSTRSGIINGIDFPAPVLAIMSWTEFSLQILTLLRCLLRIFPRQLCSILTPTLLQPYSDVTLLEIARLTWWSHGVMRQHHMVFCSYGVVMEIFRI